jgi:hypothetical protein
MFKTRGEGSPILQQLALTCCPDGDDELAALQAAMEQRHRKRGSNPDTIKHVRQTFIAARAIGIRTRADLEDPAVDRRFAEGIASLTRADGSPRWTDATQDLLRRHFRAGIRHAAEQGWLRPPPDLERLARPGGRKWREAHPPTARTRRPTDACVRRLMEHLEGDDGTWSGLRIRALVTLQRETGMPLAGALRLTPRDVEKAFFGGRIRYTSRRGARERHAPISSRAESVLRRWLDHCGPDFLFPNRTKFAPWDAVSARRDLKARSRAAGVEITFEQLQQCRDRPQDDQPVGAAVFPAVGGPEIDYDVLRDTLLRQGQRLVSRLVWFMRYRRAASFADVEGEVFEGERADSSIRSLVNRTNNAVRGLEPRLSFSAPDRQVLKHVKKATATAASEGAHATPTQPDAAPVQRPCNAK